MNIEQVFGNTTTTTNGDIAYKSSGDLVVDLIFKLIEFRENKLGLVSLVNQITSTNLTDELKEILKTLAMLVRDPRLGFGERETGRYLLLKFYPDIEPEVLLNVGRADDLVHMGYALYKEGKDINPYWNYLHQVLTNSNSFSPIVYYNVTKWMPRENGKKAKEIARAFRNRYGLSPREYRRLIVNYDTTEAVLSRKDLVKDYSKVPSLAFIKHTSNFYKNDYTRFSKYLDSVKRGEAKVNTSVTDPYTIYKEARSNLEAMSVVWDNLPKVDMPKIISIVDQSESMKSMDAYTKARAIAHYVSKNTTYMTNKIIAFSRDSRLLDLGTTLQSAIRTFNSFDDVANTNFGRTMQVLSQATEDLPDFLLVLSDMQFDEGSNESKNEAMSILKRYNSNLKIIWWNLRREGSTFPEIDKYGNIFMSGYNPKLLSMLEVGFDMYAYVHNLIKTYREKFNSTYTNG